MKKLAAAALLVLAGCGGGGGSTAAVPGGIAAGPTPSPVATQNTAGWLNTATLHFTIPASGTSSASAHRAAANARAPKYVSANTTTLNVTINSVNGSTSLPSWAPTGTTPIALTTGGATPNCTNTAGVISCSVTIPAPPGTVNYTFSATDGTYVLSTQTGNQTIAQGQNATLNITLQGVVNSVEVLQNGQPLGLDSAQTISLLVDALDADGDLINGAGAYNNPITLTDTDPTGQTTLKNVTTGASGTSITTSNHSDDIELTYTGKAINSFSVTPSGTTGGLTEPSASIGCAGGVCTIIAPTPADITLNGTTIDTNNADTSYNYPTVFFGDTSGTATVTASETAFTGFSADASPVAYGGQFNATLDPASCGSGPSAVATISGNPATSFTVTPLNPGVCKVTLAEAGTGYPLTNPAHDSTSAGIFYISVTTASIGLNGTHRR